MLVVTDWNVICKIYVVVFAKRTSWNILKFSHSWLIIIIITIIVCITERKSLMELFIVLKSNRGSMQHILDFKAKFDIFVDLKIQKKRKLN